MSDIGMAAPPSVVGGGVPVGQLYTGVAEEATRSGVRQEQRINFSKPKAPVAPPIEEADDPEPGLCRAISARTSVQCQGPLVKSGPYAGRYCVGHIRAIEAKQKHQE